MSSDEKITKIAELMLNAAFNQDLSINKEYLTAAVNMIANNINKLHKLKQINDKIDFSDDVVNKKPPNIQIVNYPANGGWIRAFYDFNKNNPENKEDVTFVYKFSDRDERILVKKEDIEGWANKWQEYVDKNKLDELRIIMGPDNWHGRRLEKNKFTTQAVRLRLFGRECDNKEQKITGCYGMVFMHETLFTKTKNDSGLCKTCEFLKKRSDVGHRNSRDISRDTFREKKKDGDDNASEMLDRNYEIAKQVALKIIEDEPSLRI